MSERNRKGRSDEHERRNDGGSNSLVVLNSNTNTRRPEEDVVVAAEGGGLFLGPHGEYKTPMFLLSVSVPLFLLGHWVWGSVALLGMFLIALCTAMEDMIQEDDKQQIRHNVMSPTDVLGEMMAMEESIQRVRERVVSVSSPNNYDQGDDGPRDDVERESQETIRQGRLVVLTGLAALAKKYNKQVQREEQRQKLLQEVNKQQHQPSQPQQQPQSSQSSSSSSLDPDLPLMCQQAAYIGLRLFGKDDDTVVAAAISLAALVAKNENVRERHLYQADIYGLDEPIRAMKLSLSRAKKLKVVRHASSSSKSKSSDKKAADRLQEEEEEERAAELQRKSCLFLGALADGSIDLARLIANEGGLQAILEAMNWFRFHEDVANWALWSIFILCFENVPNKILLVRGGGISMVLQTMRNCPSSIDVARHGIAILFDLMRQDVNEDRSASNGGNGGLDVWQIRNQALANGLHHVVAHSVKQFGDEAMDIKMMGAEILTGTDYQGDVDLGSTATTPHAVYPIEPSSRRVL